MLPRNTRKTRKTRKTRNIRNTRNIRKSRNIRKTKKTKKRGGGLRFSKPPSEIKKVKSITPPKPKKQVRFNENVISDKYSDEARFSDEFYKPDRKQISKNKKKRTIKTPLEIRKIKTAKTTAKRGYNSRQFAIDKDEQFNKDIEQLRLDHLERRRNEDEKNN